MLGSTLILPVVNCSALNHIFLFEEETSLREMLDGELWKAAVDDIKRQFVSYQLSDSDVLRCHAMSKVVFWVMSIESLFRLN